MRNAILRAQYMNLFTVLIVVSSAIVYLTGLKCESLDLIYLSNVVVILGFMLRYLLSFGSDIIIIIFNLCFFVLLLGRYSVRMLNGTAMDANSEYVLTALSLAFFSILIINLFYSLLNLLSFRLKKIKRETVYSGPNKRTIFLIKAGLSVSYFCAVIVSVLSCLYAWKNGYTSLYVDFNLPIPDLIKAVSDALPFCMALFLATLPSKKTSYIILFSYIAVQVPMLLAGKRMAFIIAVLVSITYIFLRHYRAPLKDTWIGIKEKFAFIAIVPVIIVIIPMVGFLRGGGSMAIEQNPLESMLDGQGVTLDVVSFGLMLVNDTPRSIYGMYTLAPVLDYASTNFLSRIMTDSNRIVPQTIKSATLGANYADTLSYMVLSKKAYLSGQGLGSSYILEAYIDFGYVGVLLFSVFLALLMYWMKNGFGRDFLGTFIIVLLVINIYSLPRDTATGFVVSIFQIHMVLAVLLLGLYSRLISDYGSICHEK